MRFLTRLAGLSCIVVAAVLGLFVLVGVLSDQSSAGRGVAIFLGGLALVLFLVGVRWVWKSRRTNRRLSAKQPASQKLRAVRSNNGREYSDFSFGDPPPTHKQFGYAMSLGVDIQDGMTKWMISDSIDAAIEEQRSGEPATEDQLRTIKQGHGLLPRAITRGEANRVIEFLEDYSLPCPFCEIEIIATDDVCCACGKSLRKLKIPIQLD